MRNNFINWLCNKAKIDDRIFLLTADLGYSVLEPFQEKFPNRFLNVGVAEQNMVGIASGLASEGYKPYTYSIGIFPTFRCAEQLRNDIDYHNLGVVTCTVGSGVAYGSLGYTHHAVQDLALMRSMPNTVIATPSDPLEVLSILEWQYENPSPIYLRMHKAGNKALHNRLPFVQPGKWLSIYDPKELNHKKNENICVLVIGSIAPRIKEIVIKTRPEIEIFTIPIWGQKFKETQFENLNFYKQIIVVEDHLEDGGFSSWLMECASKKLLDVKINPIALSSNTVGQVAKESTLLEPLFNDFSQKIVSIKD